MKYQPMRALQIVKCGDQFNYGTKLEPKWRAANTVGSKISNPYWAEYYRRPIPEKKAAAVDWKRVAQRMRRMLGMYTPSDRTFPMDDGERIRNAMDVYNYAVQREKRIRK